MVSGVALGDLDLGGDGVGFDVDAARAGHVLVAEFLGAGDVEEGIGVLVELEDLRLGHAVAAAIGVVAAEGPAVAEAVGFERGDNGGDVAAGVGGEVVELRVVNPAAGVLDVVGIITEPAQAQQVVQELEGHSRQRIPEEDAEDDDLAFGWRGGGHGLRG